MFGMPRRRRQVPQKLGLLDELLESQRMDFFDVRADRDDRVLGVAFADRAWEIFFDRNEFAEINPAALVDDAEAPDAENVLQPPFADDRPGRQRLVAVGLTQRRFPLGCPRIKQK